MDTSLPRPAIRLCLSSRLLPLALALTLAGCAGLAPSGY